MVNKSCLNCNKKFKIEKWILNTPGKGNFCSVLCNNKYHSGKNSHFYGSSLVGPKNPNWKGGKPGCIDCGKRVSARGCKRCRKCYLKFNSGKNHYLFGKSRSNYSNSRHHNWKGGITSVNKLERTKFRQTIQGKVFERDNYTCQICGIRGVNLQVDHIQSWKDYVELRFDMNNCRTLCAKCHYKITFSREMPDNITGWGHHLLERVGVST